MSATWTTRRRNESHVSLDVTRIEQRRRGGAVGELDLDRMGLQTRQGRQSPYPIGLQ